MSTPHDSDSFDISSVDEVFAMRKLLHDLIEDRFKLFLPYEIIDLIMDFAEIWAHTTAIANLGRDGDHTGRIVARGRPGGGEDSFVIRSLPIGVLPEQIDSDTHLGIVDGFVRKPSNYNKYPEQTATSKSQTEKLTSRWAEVNGIKTVKQPCRKIVFTIWSSDQGWGGEKADQGTFNGSYTWFDVGKERVEACDPLPENLADLHRFSLPPDPENPEEPKEEIPCILRVLIPPVLEGKKLDHPFLPPPTHITHNRTAVKELQKHVITWSYTDNITSEKNPKAAEELKQQGRGKESGNGEFVRSLKVGDTVTLWARARFPQWENKLRFCQIDVYWAV